MGIVELETYYRALYSDEHFIDWRKGIRTSFHHACDPHWVEIWNKTGSENCDDYPLETTVAVYTPAARKFFVHFAPQWPAEKVWPDYALRSASELAGLCAFDTPEGLLTWCADRPDAAVLVFEGSYVCEAPDDDGAVVVKFLRVLRFYESIDAFRADLKP